MTKSILKLPEIVINQIAAGEVVENPSSIVKELIENSIDAGASRISIEINGGGQQSISIDDDGCGMSYEDALASIERHATSKIKTAEDLSTLATMGFRGEALAAIAAVSHFEMATSNGREATCLRVEGGRFEGAEPCARNRGTTISIRSLFFNVPARKKFQKSAASNALQVKRAVESLALAHPEIAFSYVSQGKKILETAGKNGKQRIEEILGSFEHEIQFEQGDVRIWGFAASAENAILNRSGQHVFINRRAIFSPLISRAVKEGFATRIDASSHPVFVLFIEMPPDQIDVNVHPQKKEVRFQNEGKMFRLVQEAVSSTLTAMASPAPFPSFSFQDAPQFPWEAPFTPEIRPFIASDEPKFDFIYPDRFLAICGNFLLLQNEGLLLVDLKAVHARLLYESLAVEKQPAQALMWPLEIEIGRSLENLDCAEALNRIGIECRMVGEKTLAVDALPPCLEAGDFPDFFAKWQEGMEVGALAARFCRGLKKIYSLDEAQMLWRQLQKCKDLRYDPIGNPIWTEIDCNDLERWMAKKR